MKHVTRRWISTGIATILISLPVSAAVSRAQDDDSFSKTSTKVRTKKATANEFVDHPDDTKWIADAPLKSKIGQMFIFGFAGQNVTKDLSKTLKDQRPGALIVFGRNIRNPQQVVDLLFDAQKNSAKSTGLPLLIAVDQEGGNVIRLRTNPLLPSALALGETKDTKLVNKAGLYTGQLLKTLGFNMNLAPVLDIADPKTDPFVGTRAFGNSPEIVSEMGASFSAGLSEAGVMPTAKHFPGHGGVADSHHETPVKQTTLENLRLGELIPFAAGAKEIPVSAVMLAHIAFPKIDPTGVPASFSKPIVTDILRNSMNFNGLIITDDIEMTGAALITDPSERAVRAIEAGVDMVMVAWNRKLQNNAVRAVEKAIRSGRLTEARLDESLRRILRAKRTYAQNALAKKPTKEAIRGAIENPGMKELTRATLKKRFQSERARLKFPASFREGETQLLIFATSQGFYSGFREALGLRRTRFFLLSRKQGLDINRVLLANPDAIAVVHITGDQSAKFLDELDAETAARVVVVNSEAGGVFDRPDQMKNVINVHFRHPDIGKMTAEYFFKSLRKPVADEKRLPADIDTSDPGDEDPQ